MPLTVRLGVVLLPVLLTAVFAGSVAAADYTRYLAPSSVCPKQRDARASVAEKVGATRCLLNGARERRGLRRLRWNGRLDRAATLKLQDNVRCDEFSHTACAKPFLSVFKRARYVTASTRGYAVGENLAWGQGDFGTPRKIVLAWLRSDGHRRNLFSRTWREMGVAYRLDALFEGHQDVALWANTFGRRS
jgi:uncharacterized protein YkwD